MHKSEKITCPLTIKFNSTHGYDLTKRKYVNVNVKSVI